MSTIPSTSVRNSNSSSSNIELTDFSSSSAAGAPPLPAVHSEQRTQALRDMQRSQSLSARARLFGPSAPAGSEAERILTNQPLSEEPEQMDDLDSHATGKMPARLAGRRATPIRMKSAEDALALGVPGGGAMGVNIRIAERLVQMKAKSKGSEPKITGCLLLSKEGGKYFAQKPGQEERSPAHGKFIFVRTLDGTIRLGNSTQGNNAHATLSGNSLDVAYAGEVEFDEGELKWFSNQSGTYLPDEELCHQAGFDKEKFVPVKGGNPPAAAISSVQQ